MSGPEFKRRRTGVLSSGGFNAVSLPGIQAVDNNGDNIPHPLNRDRTTFDGDASKLHYPAGMFFIDGATLKLRLSNGDTVHEVDVGTVATTDLEDANLSGTTQVLGDLNVSGETQMNNSGYEFFYSKRDNGEWDDARVVFAQRGTGDDRKFELMVRTEDGLQFARIALSLDDTFNVNGTLTKGSGSFKIPHPLTDKQDTHDLVHSFTESPQADLIYSGMVNLDSEGKCTIDIDEYVGMSPGTFCALCRNVRRFVSNESSFEAVKSTIDADTCKLHIECEKKKSVEVFWMVIGERKDASIYSSTITGSDGRVVLEPVRPPEEE